MRRFSQEWQEGPRHPGDAYDIAIEGLLKPIELELFEFFIAFAGKHCGVVDQDIQMIPACRYLLKGVIN